MDNKNNFPYLPAIIALAAGLVASIVMLANHNTTLKALIVVLAFLVGFYLLGSILRAVLLAVATKEEPAEETEAEDLENIETIQNEEEKQES